MRTERRRFPRTEKFIKGDKAITTRKPGDVLYGYLQSISYVEDVHEDKSKNRRFVYKSDYKPSKVSEFFGGEYPTATIKRDFKTLKLLGFVRDIKVIGLQGNMVNAYELPYDKDDPYQWITLDTLKHLLAGANHSVIKLYVYLKYKHFCFEKSGGFNFSKKMVLNDVFGVKSDKNTKIRETVDIRLNVLIRLGLIEIKKYVYENKQGYPVPMYHLVRVNEDVKIDDQLKK